MGPLNQIDFSKFKCEVFAPDGTFIGEARMNSANKFYFTGLVPGQKYDLVFSYDGIFIVVLSFMSEEAGKVGYLSPALILFNKGIEVPSKALLDIIRDKINKRDEYHVPLESWEKKTLAVFIESNHGNYSNKSGTNKVVKYKSNPQTGKPIK